MISKRVEISTPCIMYDIVLFLCCSCLFWHVKDVSVHVQLCRKAYATAVPPFFFSACFALFLVVQLNGKQRLFRDNSNRQKLESSLHRIESSRMSEGREACTRKEERPRIATPRQAKPTLAKRRTI